MASMMHVAMMRVAMVAIATPVSKILKIPTHFFLIHVRIITI